MKLPAGCFYNEEKIVCEIDNEKIEMKSCEFYLGRGSSCRDKNDKKHHMKDTIFPIDMRPENEVDVRSFMFINLGNKELRAKEKPLYRAGYLSDLGNDGDKIELVNPNRNLVFLKVKITKDKIIGIDPTGIVRPLAFDKNTGVFYEPWFMDVGSFLFINPPETEISGDMLKIGTEGDIVREWK